jgi:hypothetical protein
MLGLVAFCLRIGREQVIADLKRQLSDVTTELEKEKVLRQLADWEIEHMTNLLARDRERVLAETAAIAPRAMGQIQVPQGGPGI